MKREFLEKLEEKQKIISDLNTSLEEQVSSLTDEISYLNVNE